MNKKLIFLITFLAINFITFINVSASTNYFYEGEYIGDIYMNKAKGGTIYYQRARFFNLKSNNKPAYCIEPFAMFNANGNYHRSFTADNLTTEQTERIKAIINFGYLYSYHYDPKWYAVTQFMVWQAADPTGDYYFTDGLNGKRIVRFEKEINEINSLINEYYKLPSINNTNVNIVENQDIILTDTNNVLSHYKSDISNVSIKNNQLLIKGLKEGNHRIHLYRKDIRTTQIPFFYNSPDSQNMATGGDLNQIDIYLNVNVIKTKLEITKVDFDNNSTISRGEAKLDGATYQLLDKDKNKIKELVINKDLKTNIENLNFGKYYIQEIKPGIGYTLDSKLYEVNISNNNPVVLLKLKNKVIEKEFEIIKNYGDDNNFIAEENISFDIFDSNNNLYDTITTNNKGIASIKLPFGKYKVKQRNTTFGYKLSEDFSINVTDTKKESKTLYDYKIKVPNTYHEESNNNLLVLLLITLFNVKKMVLC